MNIIRKILLFIASLFKKHNEKKQNVYTLLENNVSQSTMTATNPHPWGSPSSFVNEEKVEAFISEFLPDFIPLVCAHYNSQYEYCRLTGYFYEAKPYELDLAANYFIRNRCRLLEWWCLHNGKRKLFDEEDMVNYDLNGFDAAFEAKAKKLGISLDLDHDHTHGMPMLFDDKTINWKAVACLDTQLVK